MIVLIVAIILEFIVFIYSLYFLIKDIIFALIEYNNFMQDFKELTSNDDGDDSEDIKDEIQGFAQVYLFFGLNFLVFIIYFLYYFIMIPYQFALWA